MQDEYTVFIEVSPHPILSFSIASIGEEKNKKIHVIPSLVKEQPEQQSFYQNLGLLYGLGYPINWKKLYPDGELQCLPNYPWQKKRYWLDDFNSSANFIVKDSLYQMDWEKLFLTENNSKPKKRNSKKNNSKTWIIFSANSVLDDLLSKKMKSDGIQGVFIDKGNCFKHEVNATAIRYTIDPNNPKHYIELLEAITTKKDIVLDKVLWLWEAENSITKSNKLQIDIDFGYMPLLHFIKACNSQKNNKNPQLYVISRGGQKIVNTDTPDPAKSALWGLARAIFHELTEYRCSRIDLCATPNETEIDSLYKVLVSNKESELGIRGEQVYAARLNKYSKPDKEGSKNKKKLFNTDETHLITGGLGELGFSLAELMIEKGASNLVLMGRSKPNVSIQKAIDKLTGKGATIVAVQGDVSKPNDLKKILSKIKQEMPPLKGVFHAAGLYKPSIIIEETEQQFQEIFSPKVIGAYNLHNQTIGENLDYFVLFSAIASCLPIMGSSSYISANATLDGLARYRKSKNNPVVCINWGPTGSLRAKKSSKKSDEKIREFKTLGMNTMNLNEYKQVMESILVENYFQTIVVANLEVPQLIAFFPSFAKESLFTNLTNQANLPTNTKKKIQLEDIKSDEEKIIFIHENIKQSLSDVTGYSILEISNTDPLIHMGIDSMSAHRMVNTIRKEIGISIRISDILTAKSVDSLTEYVYAICKKNKNEENKNKTEISSDYKNTNQKDEELVDNT